MENLHSRDCLIKVIQNRAYEMVCSEILKSVIVYGALLLIVDRIISICHCKKWCCFSVKAIRGGIITRKFHVDKQHAWLMQIFGLWIFYEVVQKICLRSKHTHTRRHWRQWAAWKRRSMKCGVNITHGAEWFHVVYTWTQTFVMSHSPSNVNIRGLNYG